MKVIFSLFFIFLYCKQSAANDLWTIDKNISSIEFEVPVLLTKNVIGKFNEFDGFVSLDLSNQNNNKALINVRIDSLENNFKFNYEDNKIYLIGELSIKGKSQNIPINIEVIKLASELVQVKSEISFSRNDFKIGTGNWKNTTILKDKIKIKANIFLFKE